MQKDTDARVLPIRSTPMAVVPRDAVWTVDSKTQEVKILEIGGRLVGTGVKLGKKAVQY